MARLTSDFWVSAYLRRCNLSGVAAVLRRRGATEAGAIFVQVDRLDGSGDLYGPVPQAGFDGDKAEDRQFAFIMHGAGALDIEERMRRELRFDEDLWWIELESRDGEHFLTVPGE